MKDGVSPFVKLKMGFRLGLKVGGAGWAGDCADVDTWPNGKFVVGAAKLCDPEAWLPVKPNTFVLGCVLLEPKPKFGVVKLVAAVVVAAAAVVVGVAALLVLLVPNNEDAPVAPAPNTVTALGADAEPNIDETAGLDVEAALDPKLNVGPTWFDVGLFEVKPNPEFTDGPEPRALLLLGAPNANAPFPDNPWSF